jgi:hypothetical protein
MAQRPTTYAYTFASATSAALSDIIGMRQKTWILSMAVRADRGNADDISWSVRGGGKGGFIGPAEACVFDFGEAGTLVGTLAFHGKAGDKMYLTIGISSDYFDQTDLT